MPDALQLLRQDHDKVKEMFRQFENLEDRNQKKQLVDQAIMELEVHAMIEEEIFYPAMKKQLGEAEIMHEAEEEHHVADLIMEELKKMRPAAKTYDAKFMVLAENVKHHIQEEEQQMFPKAAEAGREHLAEIGMQLEQRKMELMEQMQRGGRKRAATKRRTTTRASRNGRGGRTTRTTARTRSTSGRSRSAASKSQSASGTRSRATASRSRSTSSRARGTSSRARGTSSRARGTSSRSRSTTKRASAPKRGGSRSRR